MAESQATKPSAPTLSSGGISLTFTAKKKPSIVVQVQEVEKKQEKDFITGVEGTKIKRYVNFHYFLFAFCYDYMFLISNNL